MVNFAFTLCQAVGRDGVMCTVHAQQHGRGGWAVEFCARKILLNLGTDVAFGLY